jgi:hypothetical protein
MQQELKRILWWVAGQSLPPAALFEKRMKDGLKAVACAAGAGVLLSALLLLLLYMSYNLMVAEGVSPNLAMGVVAMLTAACALFLISKAARNMNSVSHIKQDVKLFGGAQPGGLEKTIQDVAHGFVDGLFEDSGRKTTGAPEAPKKPRSHYTDTQANGHTVYKSTEVTANRYPVNGAAENETMIHMQQR